MGHESFERSEEVRGSSNRAFGLVFAAFFAIIGLFPLVFGGALRAWAFIVAAGFLGAALAFPRVLTPLNRVWIKVGQLLHQVVSPIVLGIMFFLVITPMAFLMRALGKDPLRLKFDRAAESYWIVREPPGPPPDSLKDQF